MTSPAVDPSPEDLTDHPTDPLSDPGSDGDDPGRGTDWEGVRLHVVTGKGGTGKSTVAAALALALATGGRRVLLVEVEDRQGIARLFDSPPLPFEEVRVAVAPDGGEVMALAVEPKAALLDYLEMYYHLGRAGRVLDKIGATDFATTIAPGVRDVLLTGKVYEAVGRRTPARRGRPRPDREYVYDAVVLDAPPTGRVVRFLNVTSELAGVAKVGPIRTQSDAMMAVFRSPRTAVHLVTLLEEMPVQETQDTVAELRAVGLPVGGIVVDQVREAALAQRALASARAGSMDPADIRAGLVAAGIASPDDDLVDGLLAQGREHAIRVHLEKRERADLAALDRPTYELPLLPQGVDLGGLYLLADLLREQGMA